MAASRYSAYNCFWPSLDGRLLNSAHVHEYELAP
jgi:hypothetical protein